jgi:hypothetical protein
MEEHGAVAQIGEDDKVRILEKGKDPNDHLSAHLDFSGEITMPVRPCIRPSATPHTHKRAACVCEKFRLDGARRKPKAEIAGELPGIGIL